MAGPTSLQQSQEKRSMFCRARTRNLLTKGYGVLQLLTEGKSMKEVAYTLNITANTVAFHKYQIMEVLNAKSDAELVQYAIRNHIIAA
jgi:DNA-binding NarL/FixJ family response regulator